MLSRRGGRPPYEVMNRSRPHAGGPVLPVHEEAAAVETEDEAGGSFHRWLNAHPVLIRLPRGYALLLGVGLVAVFVMVYWVGYEKGRRTGFTDGKATAEAAYAGLPGYPRMTGEGGSGAGDPQFSGAGAGARTGEIEPIPDPSEAGPIGRDTREAGLNYLVLARCPRPEAVRLVQFLRQHQVETVGVPVDNGRSFHVVDLAGFTAEGLRSEAYKQRQLLLRRLGRLWKSQERGYSDLSDMWAQKHTTN